MSRAILSRFLVLCLFWDKDLRSLFEPVSNKPGKTQSQDTFSSQVQSLITTVLSLQSFHQGPSELGLENELLEKVCNDEILHCRQ